MNARHWMQCYWIALAVVIAERLNKTEELINKGGEA